MAGVGKPKLRPSLISFIGQILKIRFGDVNNFRFQILKGYSRYVHWRASEVHTRFSTIRYRVRVKEGHYM